MKTYIPLDRLKRSRDSGSALYNMHPTDVLGRAGGGNKFGMDSENIIRFLDSIPNFL